MRTEEEWAERVERVVRTEMMRRGHLPAWAARPETVACRLALSIEARCSGIDLQDRSTGSENKMRDTAVCSYK